MPLDSDIDTVIWDLDGTLLDSFGVYKDVLTTVLEKREWAIPSHEAMHANFHGSLHESVNGALGGVSEVMLDEIVDEFLALQNVYYTNIDEHLYPDAIRLVKQNAAKGLRQILVTNRAHEGRLQASPRYIVANSMLTTAIDTVICSDDSEHRKPKSEVLGTCVIDPARTIIIGDQFVDAEFAANLGCHSIIVARDPSADPLARASEAAKQGATLVRSL